MLTIQCSMCGFPYKVPPKFKYCQCENCPWVMIENARSSYGIIKKNLDVPVASYIGMLYEQKTPGGNYIPAKDVEAEKKKKKEKRKYKRKIPSARYDYSSLIPEYEKSKSKSL